MLTSFCTGYAMGMATVGVAIILVDNYLNPKADKPEIKMPPKMVAHFEHKATAILDRQSKPKAMVETKPVKEIQPKIDIVALEELFSEEEETYTVDEILAEFK